MRENRNTYGVVVGNCEDKRPRGRPRHPWQDNSKTDLRGKIGEHGLYSSG